MSQTAPPPGPQPTRETGRAFWPLQAGSLLVPLLIFAAAALWSRGAVERDAWERLGRMVDMLHEHAVRSFETQEIVLEAVDQRLRGLKPEEIAGSREIHAFLAALVDQAQPAGGMVIVGPDDRSIAGSYAYPTPSVDLSDRDYMRAHRGGHRGTFIGEVILTRPQNLMVFSVSRRLDAPEGEFRGAVVSSFRAGYFEDFYRSVAETPHDAVVLMRDDGLLLARTPPAPAGAGAWAPRDSAVLQQARAAGQATIRTVSALDGVERLYGFRRVGAEPVFVAYGLSARTVEEAWRRQLLGYGVVCAVAAALLFGLVHLVQRAVRRERAALASARMEAERRAEAEERLRHAQRVDALGQIVGGVAHDFNNVVMAVTAATRMLGKRADNPDEVRRIADLLGGAAERGGRMTGRMLAFARLDETRTEVVDPAEAVGAVADLMVHTMGSGYRIAVERDESLPRVRGDRAEFETAVINLVLNGRDAMPDGGTVTVEARAVSLDGPDGGLQPGRYVRIAVIDHGIGMDADTLARVGEAFFTTKDPGKGTGLGLAMARGFAERSGGALAIESAPGRGTTVTIRLPAAG
jgi:two-component system NtrC family sensor kinase